MIHGSIVRLYSHRITLPTTLLGPIGFEKGAHVSGFYYPAPQDEEYAGVRHKIDLGFTPFPFRLWPRTIVISVFLNHHPGSLLQITSCLVELRINILSAHIVRFGHRYAQWDMAVDVSDFEMPGVNERVGAAFRSFEDLEGIATAVAQQIDAFDRSQEKTKGAEAAFLFRKLKVNDSVTARAIFLLWDHYKRIRDAEEDDYITKHDRLFYGKCADGYISLHGSKWNRVLRRSQLAGHLASEDSFIYGIAACDSDSFTARAVLIRREFEDRFARFRIVYERQVTDELARQLARVADATPYTTRGLLMKVAASFSDCNLWWTTNRTVRHDRDNEIGTIELLAEAPDGHSSGEFFADLRASLEAVKGSECSTTAVKEAGFELLLERREALTNEEAASR